MCSKEIYLRTVGTFKTNYIIIYPAFCENWPVRGLITGYFTLIDANFKHTLKLLISDYFREKISCLLTCDMRQFSCYFILLLQSESTRSEFIKVISLQNFAAIKCEIRTSSALIAYLQYLQLYINGS